MNSAIFISFILFMEHKKTLIAKKFIKRKNKGDTVKMQELAKRLIGKECVICFFDGNNRKVVIKEVTDGAILAEKGDNMEVINLDFVMRIKA